MFLPLLLLLPLFAHAQSGGAQTGWEAYAALQDGNLRFYEGRATHQNQNRRGAPAGAQKPQAIVISCSDSRLPPEIIFDQGLGDLFVVRGAGNTVSSEAIASVEYAIDTLGARLLVVLGHESCGNVKEAVNTRSGAFHGSGNLDALVEHIRGHISAAASAAAAADPTLRLAVKDNVADTLQELMSKSEIVAEAVRQKGLVLAQGIYSLKTGRVEFWDVGAKLELAPGAASEAPKIKEQLIQEEIIPAVAPPERKKVKVNLR